MVAMFRGSKTSRVATSRPQHWLPVNQEHLVSGSGVYKVSGLYQVDMGDCQNYGPFLGPYYNTGPNTGPNLGDPKRDHNFDNPPYSV